MAQRVTPLRWWLERRGRGSISLLAEVLGVSGELIRQVAEGETYLGYDLAVRTASVTGLKLRDLHYVRRHRHAPPMVELEP